MIILASKSTGRLATLRAAGIEPRVEVSSVDEGAVLAALAERRAAAGGPAPSPAEQVLALARAKALDVADAIAGPDGPADAADQRTGPTGPGGRAGAPIVVGCDSMLEIDGAVVGKPRAPEAARERWLAMRGRTGVLRTGHALVRPADGARAEGVSSAIVHFGEPSEAEIDAYIATGEPLWCAGAFTIDGLGGAFIEGIEGDPHGVVGISLPLLRRLLAELGVNWTDLWA
ncbi:spermidine synthase [Actinomyces sp. Chiba101]|uniref:Nucleoside triphosphate pyrophosphatase n=1 Tax=Actinomyces denticolens TaxID=52767 RepID=A0ABY1I0N4_9ACTO|nr:MULTISPECIES: Maf family protein [Actinomyces]BAW93852.1 spermidine synthase [Actinomyces sp. Chiba101]GAV93893.1 spermidine synthase [Actinomyces denticolens]SHI28703.1 septum formation protein [Actinomyces denticolens]SUU74357.1 Septum formation protein Maf [Actinomyces denticolens]